MIKKSHILIELKSGPDMVQLIQTVFVAILLSISSNGMAQNLDFGTPEFEKTVRVKYINSQQLPDGVAFHEIMKLLDAMNSSDPEVAAGWIQNNMGLSNTAAVDFLTRMLTTLPALTADIDEARKQLACESGVPRAAGGRIYPVFEAMADAAENIAAEHLITMNGKVGEQVAGRLQQWLYIQKANISHVKWKYKEYYERSGRNADAVLAAICNEFEARSGGIDQ